MTEFYSTGTIGVTNGSVDFIGTGTVWLPVNAKAGDMLNVAGHVMLIAELTDAAHGKFAVAYPGATAAGLAYAIAKTSSEWGTNRTLSLQTAELIQALTTGAAGVSFDPPSGMAADTVQEAIEELHTSKFPGTETIKTAAYTATAGDIGKTIILNKATADSLSFAAAATLGSQWMVFLKNIGAGTWTLDPNGAETIDGAATISLASGQSMVVASNGAALRSYFLSSVGGSVLTKTAAYTVVAGDARGLVRCDATAGALTVSLTSAATLGAGFEVSVKKVDSSKNVVTIDPAGAETIDGAATFVLDEAYEEVVLVSNGTNWEVLSYHSTRALNSREVLTANRTYYVRTDGSDSNNGLSNTAGEAFATIQKAINVVSALDLSTFNVTISVGSGTWSGSVQVLAPWIGSGNVTIDGGSASTTTLSSSSTCLRAGNGGKISIANVTLVAATQALEAYAGGQITFGAGLVFGACGSSHMRSNGPGSKIITNGMAYTISGNSPSHYNASPGGYIEGTSSAVTLIGTLNFSNAFVYADRLGLATFLAASFNVSGATVTGKRYSATSNAVINSGGGGATFFPGSIDGTFATGGLYL